MIKRVFSLILIAGCVLAIASASFAQGGIGMVKEPTRLHPGWESITHPHVKSFLPGIDPISKLPMVRKGEWACPVHPEVSATAPGKCPLGGEDLVKVEDLEKQTGKTIDELTELSLEKQKKE